ncbi:MAG: hypothetical protein M3M85_02195 [bacterium]|nr:hypothetical protein [bacterium]
MIFGFSKKKEELVLSLHIGSGMVGGALVLLDSAGIPKIVFSVTESVAPEEKLNTQKFFLKTLKAVETVTDKIHKSGLGAPERIFCVLASPWYASQTRVIELKKNTPFIFTEKIADELIQKEIKIMSEEHVLEYGDAENAIRTIELKNIKTTLNGYETPEPLYKKTKELEMIIFISLSGEKILAKIEDAIRKSFQFESIKFSSFAMASFTVSRDLNPNQENFLLLDIGGEITEIFMVKKNVLRDSISYPLGRNFFIRSVALEFGCTVSEAESLISLFQSGHAEEKVAANIKSTMDKIRGEWLAKFQESLANLSSDISIPSLVHITGDSNFVDLFAATIKAEQFSQYTLAEAKFEINIIDTKLLHNLATFGEEATRDTFIILDSVYINRFLTKSAQ